MIEIQSLFLFYKATAVTASSTQEAMIENAPENEISSYENYLNRSAIHYQRV